MERYHQLLFAIWREACRHIEIHDSASRIAGLLAEMIPVGTLTVVAVERAGSDVERLCHIGVTGDIPIPALLSIEKSAAKRLSEWCASATPMQCIRDRRPRDLPSPLFDGLLKHVLVIPLQSEHGAQGLFLLSNEHEPYHEREVKLGELLAEPFAVALENDRRVHELMTLREAAEADKRKLLNRLGREQLTDEVIGAGHGLRAVMERVELVSRSDVPVLILGETGAGKEVIARAIHEGSPRAVGPFIRVNCGAIPTELIDSELFGHERGSFTGAVAERKGWFERADGGTLFLDEIGELPPAAQVRLLRVLQDSSFERVGGEKALHVNVRIVAATHRDLARMVQEQRFREDLWYRVAVFPIVLPPLRERKQDIPALAEHFAERASRRFGLKQQTPTSRDITLLSDYDWPGNVREFASVLDRAAILGDGRGLEVAKALGIAPTTTTISAGQSISEPNDHTMVTLDEAMRGHIVRALTLTRGKIEGERGAAAMLGINPHTLRARMRKLEIDWKRFRVG